MEKDFQNETVTIESAYSLKGTLSFPKDNEGPFPAVLMLHGSGPTDRDENVKNMRLNAFKDLSDAIVPFGIATLRYDKRGVGESGGDYYEAGMWDLVDDAEAAVEFLKNHSKIDTNKIYLLGHSEGSVLAPAVHSRIPVQGLILLAGAAESVKDSILRQGDLTFKELEEMKGFRGTLINLFKLPEKAKQKQLKTFEKIEASTSAVIRMQFQKTNAKWMREHFKYNVVDDLKKVTIPLLAITGDKDIQVLPEHAKKIAELSQGESDYYIIKDLNHILRRQQSKPSMFTIKQEYKKLIEQPIDSEVISIVTEWLKKQIEKS